MYSRAKNPAWENFLDLFTAIDKGAKGKREISAFNGGLFADDPAINALELVEEKWTNAFTGFGNYDFSEEINVDVLGHLFERLDHGAGKTPRRRPLRPDGRRGGRESGQRRPHPR